MVSLLRITRYSPLALAMPELTPPPKPRFSAFSTAILRPGASRSHSRSRSAVSSADALSTTITSVGTPSVQASRLSRQRRVSGHWL